ncbi:hypothetical protein ACFQ3P_32855 [Paraburkholderia sabiae]|uniref:Uncharacterized protein n=1 Tax=Paraburkholderia sabiae TaxID=273251 RepID=A0ABU9QJJ8_9BURK|nr:hypothetical protein [Paraburkholderia sabiae]WJZ79743.1 hypothetical protein QEN71_43680 [Paraburkholderia sabiae]CAD6559391.1 hypothetical protein LMG24235_06660 [Paraburkholderia sabiae]
MTMNILRKTLFATTVAGAMIAGAHAATTIEVLDVSWYKDGKLIDGARHTLSGDGMPPQPVFKQRGQQVGYLQCTRTAIQIDRRVKTAFVGRSLAVTPVTFDGDKANLMISAMDTELTGKHEIGTADCVSEVLDVSGYSQSDIAVDVADGKTVDVPLSDPHYQLKVSLHHEML